MLPSLPASPELGGLASTLLSNNAAKLSAPDWVLVMSWVMLLGRILHKPGSKGRQPAPEQANATLCRPGEGACLTRNAPGVKCRVAMVAETRPQRTLRTAPARPWSGSSEGSRPAS